MTNEAIVEEILRVMRKLKVFTREELQAELSTIPDDTQKDHCVDWVLLSPSVSHVFELYRYVG